MTEVIRTEGELGEHINAAIERAIQLASEELKDVVLTFNGTTLRIKPGSETKALYDEWTAMVQKALDEYMASPEGQAHQRRLAEQKAKDAARQAAGPRHDEATLRAALPPKIESPEQLAQFVESVTNGTHSYGSCSYAMSLAAVAAFNYVGRELGVSGFQQSVAELDFLRRARRLDAPYMLVTAEDALYPQRDIGRQLTAALVDWQPWIREQAKKLLAERQDGAAHHVIDHWKQLAAGEAVEVVDVTSDLRARVAKLEDALRGFVSTIDNTGGLAAEDEGGVAADPEWTDLADAYLTACDVLGHEPVENKDEE